MSIAKLIDLIPVPTSPAEVPRPSEWTLLRESLEIELPEDYEDLINIYGTGSFGEFLWIFSPFTNNVNINLIEQKRIMLSRLHDVHAECGVPFPFQGYGTDVELFPLGDTANGDELFWLYSKNTKKPIQIVINEVRTFDWEYFDPSISSFLAGIFDGTIEVLTFPDDFPSPEERFHVYVPQVSK